MCRHEEKKCPVCNAAFECKAGSITECQCFGVPLSLEERAFIESKYEDCICNNCLLELKDKYILFREKYLLK